MCDLGRIGRMHMDGLKSIVRAVRNHASVLCAGSFNWREAQEYELRHSRTWISDNFESLFARIQTARERGERWPGPHGQVLKEFFAGDLVRWREFAEHISGRTCLEIGAGPCGALAIWWWVRRRIVIDPLVEEYRQLCLSIFGRTWYGEEIELYARPAESFIKELAHTIDGAIICRNTLDHCEEPMSVLQSISDYAAPGCVLLLWTDLWHPEGQDAGHRNITNDSASFERVVSTLGFDILRAFADHDRATTNYGCCATKRQPAQPE